MEKSWHQKNRIKGPNGDVWLTIPVLTKGKRFQKISEAEIDNSKPWAAKHLRSIEFCYAKAPFASRYIPALRDIYETRWERLADLNIRLISFLMDAFCIHKPIVRSSQLEYGENSRDGHIIAICKQLKATELYDAAGAAPLLDLSTFKAAGIEVIFQDYHHPVYHQLHGEFVPKMSALDLLFNEGLDSLEIMLSKGEG
jgi:hypothetical protein